MASLRKHPKSSYWIACYRDANGRQTTRSTKETDRKRAQELADKFEQVAKGYLSVTQAQKVIAEVYRRSTGVNMPCLTVREYLGQWASAKAPEIAASTAEKYRYCVAGFLKFLGTRADQPLLHISERDLTSFRDACAKQGTAKTANNKLVILTSAFRKAWKQCLIPEDIGNRVEKLELRGQQNEREGFTQEQVDEIIKNAEGEWKGIAMFGAYTGQRLGDIANLRWKDIDGTILCFESKKGHRNMRVPLDPMLAAWLASLRGKRQPHAPLFPEAYASYLNNQCKVAALSKQFRALLAKLGYTTKREYLSQGKGRTALRAFSALTFHSFRHYLTSHMHRAGIAAAIVRDIIGHDSEVVNRIYTDIDDNTKVVGFLKFAAARDAAQAAAPSKPMQPAI